MRFCWNCKRPEGFWHIVVKNCIQNYLVEYMYCMWLDCKCDRLRIPFPLIRRMKYFNVLKQTRDTDYSIFTSSQGEGTAKLSSLFPSPLTSTVSYIFVFFVLILYTWPFFQYHRTSSPVYLNCVFPI